MMLSYELKKTLSKRINRVLLGIGLSLVLVFSVFAIGSFRAVDADGTSCTGMAAAHIMIAEKNLWQGALTPEVIAEVVDRTHAGDWQSTLDIVYSTSKMLLGEFSDLDDYEAILSAGPAEVSSLYDIYHNNLLTMSAKYGETPEKEAFLTEQYEKITLPFHYEAYDSWDTMLLYATTTSLVLIMVIGYLSAGLFAEDFQYKADSVFFSTQYGRSKAVHTKIRAGLIMATLVYGLGVSLLSVICFGVLGVSGVSTAYQFSQPYAIYSLTFGQVYGIVLLGGYIASLLSASISMLVASRTRTMSIAVLIPFILFCVSPFIGRALPLHTFFTLTPDQLTNIVNCARVPYTYQIGSMVFRQIPFILVFYAVISAALLPLVYRNFHKLLLK